MSPTGSIFITSHNSANKATYHSADAITWTPTDSSNTLLVGRIFSHATFPAEMSTNADIEAHNESEMSIGIKGGTESHMCIFAPGKEYKIHRTHTLDYGIIVEGSLDLELDSGEVKTMKAGDVCVIRGCMHAWKNPSDVQAAKIFFVSVDAAPVVRDGQELPIDFTAHQ